MVGSLNKLPKSSMRNFFPPGFPENGPNLHFIFLGKGFPSIFKNYYHHDLYLPPLILLAQNNHGCCKFADLV